jgi:hypothetical protein
VQLPVPSMQRDVHHPVFAVGPSTAGQSSSRSTRDTFADVDDEDDADAVGQDVYVDLVLRTMLCGLCHILC